MVRKPREKKKKPQKGSKLRVTTKSDKEGATSGPEGLGDLG